MSKRYTLKINNANNYAMIVDSYSVYDGDNNLITSGTNLNVAPRSYAVLGTQVLNDIDTCYWGGSVANFTSVGAPTIVTGSLTRGDYNLYTLSANTTTTTYGLNNYSIALSMVFTDIVTSGTRNFEISNTSDFAIKKAFGVTLSGTNQNYTATLTQSDLVGVLSSGITSKFYIRDITIPASPIVFIANNTITYHKLLSPTITGVDTGVIYEYTVHNTDSYACIVWSANDNDPNSFVNKGTISANGTLTYTSNSNAVYVQLRGSYLNNSDVVSHAISFYNLTLHQLRVSTTGEYGTYNVTSSVTYTKQYNTINDLYADGFDDWLAQSVYSSGYLVNQDSSGIFLNTGANYFMDMYIYSNGTLTAPTFSGNIGITKNSTTYTLTASITNPNNVSCKLFTRSTNTTFTSQTILPNETLTITKNELISSGSNGYIYAYLTSDNYINSSTSQKAWADTLSAPIISIVSIVKNGVVYNVNINVENNNATSCDFYGNAQSSSTGTPQNLLGSISANSQQQFTITTSLNVGYVIGQFKATDYNDSAVTSIPFSYVYVTPTLVAPSDLTIISVTPNGVLYDVNFSVSNNNAVTCDLYANAQSSSGGTPQNLIGSIAANTRHQFSITTSQNYGYVIAQFKATDYNDSATSYDSYSYVVAPSTTSIPVNVVMEDDGQGGYRANVYITNNSTYNLSGTMSDFYINIEQQSATQTISNLTINSSINLYGTVAQQSMEHSQDWYVTLNLTDGINNWTLNYNGVLA